MASFIRTLARALKGAPPYLVCTARVWGAGVRELAQRARVTESGAFLLGTTRGRTRRIRHFLFYDDVDPTCFARGIVEFDGRNFGKVWEQCRARGYTVVADVHVHPGHFAQSSSDRNNPMIAEVGHIALILPNSAVGASRPNAIGVYEYLGNRRWRDHSTRGDDVFHIGAWP